MEYDATYKGKGVWLVYDGDCPLCRHSAQAVALREQCGPLHLINARDHHDHQIIKDINARQFDLDEGIVIFYQGEFYHGSQALRFIAVHSTPEGIGNKLVRLLFRYDVTARLFYPVLKWFRNGLLKVLGVKKINAVK